jgi:hypothetical protein
MSAKGDELRPKPFTERVVGERLALIFGIVAFPALAIRTGHLLCDPGKRVPIDLKLQRFELLRSAQITCVMADVAK